MDMISELPDDILIYVFSSLTLKEAGIASVVSKRWTHMWKYNPTLIFDYSEIVDRNTFPTYLNWMDKVVSSHEAPTIDEFSRVCVDIELLEGSDTIDNWFRFAMAKRVKRLEIDLTPHRRRWIERRHMFPTLMSLCNTLTSLKLGFINIDGEILERILCNCQALEYISVKYSNSLVHLKVSGPSLNLKHLTIYYCNKVRQLEISAPKLEYFCYYGFPIKVQFKSTPKLVEVSVGGIYADGLTNICSDLSSYRSQIRVFRIDCIDLLYYLSVEEPVLYESLKESILFARLEKLDMVYLPDVNNDLYYITLMIKACPYLQHFKLWLNTFLLRRSLVDSLNAYSDCKTRDQLKWEACPHYHLEILEIVGFIGYPIDLEFAAYLMESALSLNKIIADTRDVLKLELGDPRSSEDTEERRLARERAELLRANLKPVTKLEII